MKAVLYAFRVYFPSSYDFRAMLYLHELRAVVKRRIFRYSIDYCGFCVVDWRRLEWRGRNEK